MWFLELGFVEVSSDGENFFRFPAVTYVQTETQLGGAGCIDPAQIHNFASKYGAMYGTPFELDEIPDHPLLDKNNITHVRVVDVVGCIQPEYCTYDSQGHIVNDPWPTPFASCGMDLDAVGVIHDIAHFPTPPDEPPFVANPVDDVVFDAYPQTIEVNLDGVVSDPDDPDEDIVYSIHSNSNETELSATLNGKLLTLTRLSREAGVVTVAIRATSNGQSVSFEIKVIINFVPDGVGENEQNVVVYPNPLRNRMFVKAENLKLVEVFNLMGQLLLSSTETETDLGQLAEGVYLVRIVCDDGIFTKRVVKQ